MLYSFLDATIKGQSTVRIKAIGMRVKLSRAMLYDPIRAGLEAVKLTPSVASGIDPL